MSGPVSGPVSEGEILAGKYRVDKVLGVGGMGVVVAAHHIELDEKVAIKFLLPETLTNAEAVTRFSREARAAVKIKSEHVAKVTDVGRLESGAPYMVMEYLEGGDLSGWLSQRGALPIEQAVEFVLQACEAIAEAHALGIVHRDLKPANLFVTRRPDGTLTVKVLDFGISKVTSLTGSGGDANMTKTSALMGSPLYMSPEQMQSSKDVDARGDIWALGVILYELVTGEVPFGGETMPELILNIMNRAPQPLRNRRPDAPDGLEAVLLRCVEKDRGKRFQTVAELGAALLPFAPKRSKISVERISGVLKAAGLSGTALQLPPSSDYQGQATAAGTAASWGSTGTDGGRGRVAAVTVAVLLGIAGIAVFVLTRSGEPEPAAEPASPAAPAPPAPVAQPEPVAPIGAAEPPSVKEEPAPVPVEATPVTASGGAASLDVKAARGVKAVRGVKATPEPKPVVTPVAAPPPSPPAPERPPPPSPPPRPPQQSSTSIFDDRK